TDSLDFVNSRKDDLSPVNAAFVDPWRSGQMTSNESQRASGAKWHKTLTQLPTEDQQWTSIGWHEMMRNDDRSGFRFPASYNVSTLKLGILMLRQLLPSGVMVKSSLLLLKNNFMKFL
ncbi:jg27969, partial [Pararge aegeria aegeria]